MAFLSEIDILEEFGIEPINVDSNLSLCNYVVKSSTSEIEMDFSFSSVTESFQVVLRLARHEIAVFSSENVQAMEVVRDDTGAGIRVLFGFHESISEARVMFGRMRRMGTDLFFSLQPACWT